MALRVGIINIMPRLEAYEPLLDEPFARARVPVERVYIRLATHGYTSSDRDYLARKYQTFDAALEGGPLDGLVLTGAPVEDIDFEDVHYWPELSSILRRARTTIASTLGLCWGGMALAKLLGIDKIRYPQKLFGVYANVRVEESALTAGQGPEFPCAHSRHAGIADAELEHAAGRGTLSLLAHGPATGYSLFETPDHRFVAHLGHPEYVADRLVFEYERDRALGRTDVPPPHQFDPDHPVTSWHEHREQLLDGWLGLLR
jgi:homoserine O-succinyltransferase/O-acetyltransferase